MTMTTFTTLENRKHFGWTLLAIAVGAVAFGALFWHLRGDAAAGDTTRDVNSEAARIPEVSDPIMEGSALSRSETNAHSQRRDLSLPPLDVDPETYSRLAENPFRCEESSKQTSHCDWRFDPMIARSPAEARWMASRGYPTTDERVWARSRTSAELVDEAKRTGSPSMWALALERRVLEAKNPDEAEDDLRALGRVADSGVSLYALERAAESALHVAELILAEAPDPAVRTSETGSAETWMSIALNDAAKAAVLGDPGAMVRVLQKAPGDWPELYGGPLNQSTPAYAAEMMQNALVDLREAQALANRGELTARRFTVADISPRPTPVLVRNRRHGDVWTGEP